jgi:hypothetical protein
VGRPCSASIEGRGEESTFIRVTIMGVDFTIRQSQLVNLRIMKGVIPAESVIYKKNVMSSAQRAEVF